MLAATRDDAGPLLGRDAEMEMLSELAQRESVSMSEWIRNCIRREHALVGAKAAKRVKTKR